jgi:glutathionyl-hydroquinone reductase
MAEEDDAVFEADFCDKQLASLTAIPKVRFIVVYVTLWGCELRGLHAWVHLQSFLRR